MSGARSPSADGAAKVLAKLAVYDDAALEALASRGLVRRAAKDVAAGKAQVSELAPDRVVVLADGETVEMDARGPQSARCTCRADAICRHTLAAVIVLRSSGSAVVPAAEPRVAPGLEPKPDGVVETAALDTVAPGGTAPAADPLAELLAITPAALQSWAGRPSLRAALALLAETPAVRVTAQGATVVVRFGHEGDAAARPEVRFLAGQGLAGMVSKVPTVRQRAVHAAAVIAVQRAHGVAPQFEEATLAGAPAGDGAGEAREAADVPAMADPAFHAAVRTALEDAVSTALAQAPLVLEDRLFELAVSSRTDRLPRLAGLLRRLSSDIAARRRRDVTLDPAAMLGRLAAAYALNDALDGPGLAGEARRTLAGEVRQSYAPHPLLTLHGLGGQLWETPTGARGVTGYFYAEEIGRMTTVSLARAAGQDPNFNPREVFQRDAIWRAAPLASLVRATVRLVGGAVSPAGRLSLGAESSGTIVGPSPAITDKPADLAALGAWPVTRADWVELQHGFARDLAAGALIEDRPFDAVLLVPSAHAATKFDDLRQTYAWPVADAAGRWLTLSVPHDGRDDLVGLRLTRFAKLAAVRWILALPRLDGDRIALSPVAMSAATPSQPRIGVYTVPLGAEGLGMPSAGMLHDWFVNLAKRPIGAPPTSAHVVPDLRASPTRQALTALADDLLAIADLGGRRLELAHRDRLSAQAVRLERFGLATLAATVGAVAGDDGRASAPAVLRAVHLLDRTASMARNVPWSIPAAPREAA